MQKQTFAKKDIAEHYDEFSFLYENWSGAAQGGYHFGIAEKIGDIFHNDQMVHNLSNHIIDSFKIEKLSNPIILDAGCGVGDVANIVASSYPKSSVYGVTISKEQCSIAQKKYSKAKNIKILNGDFEKTNLDDKIFNVVYFIDSFCHGDDSDKKKVLAESYRLLKPGGKLVICDVFLQKGSDKWSRWFKYINKKVTTLWRVNMWSVENDIKTKASEIGYTNYQANNLTWRIVPSVLHVIFTKIPLFFFKFLRDRKYKKEFISFLQIGIFAPLLGMHPTFRYQLVTLEKPK
jgi:MPBQ/MSBQ methyltransferase